MKRNMKTLFKHLFVFMIILIVAGIPVKDSIHSLSTKLKYVKYPTAEAVVVDISKAKTGKTTYKTRSGTSRHRNKTVTYTNTQYTNHYKYKLDSETYGGSFVTEWNSYDVGDNITIYYDSEDPSSSYYVNYASCILVLPKLLFSIVVILFSGFVTFCHYKSAIKSHE